MPVTVIQGEQRGDEGKGRYVDMLAAEHDIVARFNGGNNAGHTVILPEGTKLKLHMVPSGIAHSHAMNVIGNGTFVNAAALADEIDYIINTGIEVSPENLMLSSAANLILPHHILIDRIREGGAGRQGTTQKGISPCAEDKAARRGVLAEYINNDPNVLYKKVVKGLRGQSRRRAAAGLDPIDAEVAAEEYVEKARRLGDFITDTTLYLGQELRKSKPARVLAEAAQAFLLDVDHGMAPYTTSSSPTAGGAAAGLGIPPFFIERVVGVSKAVQSHVGDGPFVTEITEEPLLERLHGDLSAPDAEFGTATGRRRRLGYLDLAGIRRSQLVNGTDVAGIGEMALTKLDWVPRFGERVLICTAYTRKGKILPVAPDTARKLEQSTPLYAMLPTWEEDIQDVRDFDDLPENARNYISFIEEQMGSKVTMIGVGQRRDQVILRDAA